MAAMSHAVIGMGSTASADAGVSTGPGGAGLGDRRMAQRAGTDGREVVSRAGPVGVPAGVAASFAVGARTNEVPQRRSTRSVMSF
jgi:hypothetical protein